MPRLPLATLACLSLALGGAFLVACGSDDKAGSDSSAQTQAAPEPTPSEDTGGTSSSEATDVGMKDSKFVPETVSVAVGQMIRWTNNDGYAHNVSSTSGEKIDSGNIEGNAKFEFTPKKVGTIAYTCTLHSNQNGTITVKK